MNGTPQTNYDIDLAPRARGSRVDSRQSVVESHEAVEQILFGDPLMSSDTGSGVRLPKRNTAALTESGDFVTGNVANLNVNGAAIVAVNFTTNALITSQLLAAAIDAALLTLGITSVTTVGGSGNHVLTTSAIDASVTFTNFVVTGGSGQITATFAYSDSAVFRGVAEMIEKQLAAPGIAGYAKTESVSTYRRGLISVEAKGAVAKDQPIYPVIATSGSENCFTTTSTGNGNSVGISRSDAADGALFDAEFNLP